MPFVFKCNSKSTAIFDAFSTCAKDFASLLGQSCAETLSPFHHKTLSVLFVAWLQLACICFPVTGRFTNSLAHWQSLFFCHKKQLHIAQLIQIGLFLPCSQLPEWLLANWQKFFCQQTCWVWQLPKMQTEIALFATEAECAFLSAGMKLLVRFHSLFFEMNNTFDLSLESQAWCICTVFSDHSVASTLTSTDPPRLTPWSKHVAIKCYWFWCHLADEIVMVQVPAKEQKGSGFTKPLELPKFTTFHCTTHGWCTTFTLQCKFSLHSVCSSLWRRQSVEISGPHARGTGSLQKINLVNWLFDKTAWKQNPPSWSPLHVLCQNTNLVSQFQSQWN